jgi:hypothetical protein
MPFVYMQYFPYTLRGKVAAAMMLSHFLLIVLLSGTSSAVVINAQTASITSRGKVPSTIAQAPKLTEAPAVHHELFRRDITVTETILFADANVCGYFNGSSCQCLYCVYVAPADDVYS